MRFVRINHFTIDGFYFVFDDRLGDAESQAFMKKVPFGTGLAGADEPRTEVER
jgi:hypothetical protein